MSYICCDSTLAGSGVVLMGLILDHDGARAVQADVSSITYLVNDVTSGTPVSVITSTAVTVGTSIFDSLQTPAAWTKDDTGYNFRHALPVTAFPTAGHVYSVEYTFTPTAGAVYLAKYQISAR